MKGIMASKLLLGSLVMLMTALQSLGDNCNSLDGAWYSQIGSMITLMHTTEGQLQGSYLTAEQRISPANASSTSNIVGASPYDRPGAMFGFAVTFNNGESTMVWIGQCKMCGRQEVLMTSWLMRSRVRSCLDKWKSTVIGQDIFTRDEQVSLNDLRTKRDLQPHDRPDSMRYVRKKRAVTPYLVDNCRPCLTTPATCSLSGYWYNDVGSEMKIVHRRDNVIGGEYRTAVERNPCAAGTSHSSVYGLRNFTDNNSTLAFFVVWRNGASMTGWVGQCHVCRNANESLETAWILRQQIDKCSENWKSTLYGVSSFTRYERQAGPREHLGTHTPDQDGENDDGVHVACKGSNLVTCSPLFNTLSLFAIASCTRWFSLGVL